MSTSHGNTWRMRGMASRVLIALGAAAVAWWSFESLQSALARRHHAAALELALGASRADVPAPPIAIGDPIARLDIPRIGLSAVVVEGDGESALAHSIGHLPDTPMPWSPGNSAFAAHRDGLFHPLKKIQTGDIVQLTTIRGPARYRVVATRVVEAADLSVLAPTARPTLTLITCYPFDYIGPAPNRFVVHAERVSPDHTT